MLSNVGILLGGQSATQLPSDCCFWAGGQPQLPLNCGDWPGGQHVYRFVMSEPAGQHLPVFALKFPPGTSPSPGHLSMNGCFGRQLPLSCGTCPTGQQDPVNPKAPDGTDWTVAGI
jgi:hypothetical protein